MPIGFHPDDTARIHLDCFDKDKPDAERAVFVCKFLTANQVREVDRLRQEAANAKTDAEADDKINVAIMLAMTGWQGVKDHAGNDVAFGLPALGDMSIRLKQRIAYEFTWRIGLSEQDRKN